jgi:methylated-DNA-[protein]-cysteine S-methyltransferase
MQTLAREEIREIQPARSYRFSVAVFSTDFGWFGLWGNADGLAGLAIGHASRESARRSVRERLALVYRLQSADRAKNGHKPPSEPTEVGTPTGAEWAESDWNPDLRRRLQDYTLGSPDDFRDVCVLLPKLTAFQRAVIDATRQIPCGETRSYAELAAEAGRPGAARAVGNVMASNRVPIVIPCHRVVASGGKWGGFSAPQGVDLKRRMLDVEAAG